MVIYYITQPYISMARVVKRPEGGLPIVNRVWWDPTDKKWFDETEGEDEFYTKTMMVKGTKKSLVKDVFKEQS